MNNNETSVNHGAPASAEGRLEKEMRCYAFLEKAGVEYERADHPAAENMEMCEAIDDALGCVICKNLFLCNRQETDFYLLLMPPEKPFKTKTLSHELGVSRLSFASAENMLKYLDITPGAVSVLGLINDKEKRVQLLIDKDVLKNEYFGCHPCVNTSSLKMKTADLTDKILKELGIEYKTVLLIDEEETL